MAGPSASFDIDQDDSNASFTKNHEHGDKDKMLSEEIAGTLARLNTLPSSSKRRCIYKVPDDICQSNKEAYTPQVISIGPFHRGNGKLKKMEEVKLRYLKSFKHRAAEIKLIDLVRTIRGAEESVRECYSETIELGSDDFVKMILVDASFIIEFFRRNRSELGSENQHRILTNSLLRHRMELDLILLENQLPFFIIDKIYDTAFPSLSKGGQPFIELSFRWFGYYNVQNSNSSDSVPILHFTDLLRNFSLPTRKRPAKRNSEIIKEMRSTTQLARAGLKFTMTKSENCSPLELKYEKGVLEIPRFQLDKGSEIYARNLIAFEQLHYPEDQGYITEYYFLLSLLIRGKQDVSFLVRKEIVKLVDQGIDPPSMLIKIIETIDCSFKTEDYSNLAEKTNKFYKARGTYLHFMKAKLKRDYFSTPWSGAATIGGILLLLLTVIQTVCALMSVKNWK